MNLETTRILSVNLTGTLLCIKAVMSEMKKNGRGSIVNILSAAGLVGGISGSSVAYSSTKSALRGLIKEIAIGVAHTASTPFAGETCGVRSEWIALGRLLL